MKNRFACLAGLALAFASTPALAHPGHGPGSGFAAGFWHPLTGVDHLAAMLLVGLWAGLLSPRAALVLPMAFLGAMLAGFGTSALLAGGAAEPLIVASLLGLGAMAAFRFRASLPVAAAIVALFGFFHGQAHGIETPFGAAPLWFAAGFALSSGALQAFGLWLARMLPAPVLRGMGVAGFGLGLALASAT